MLLIQDGKGAKDRIVYLSNDALHALLEYLRVRPANKVKKVFLVEKGPLTGQPLSIRGIQKRIEYYARKTGLKISPGRPPKIPHLWPLENPPPAHHKLSKS
jgi:site-specific recombinase XerC